MVLGNLFIKPLLFENILSCSEYFFKGSHILFLFALTYSKQLNTDSLEIHYIIT